MFAMHLAELETAKGLIAQAIYKKCFVDVAINDVLMPLRRKGSANLQIHVDGLPLQTICLQWDPVLCEALEKYFNFQEVKTSVSSPTAKLDRLSDNDREAVEWAAKVLAAGGSIDLRVRHSHPSLTSYTTGGVLSLDSQYLYGPFKYLSAAGLREALAAGGGWKSRAVFLHRLCAAYQRTL